MEEKGLCRPNAFQETRVTQYSNLDGALNNWEDLETLQR